MEEPNISKREYLTSLFKDGYKVVGALIISCVVLLSVSTLIGLNNIAALKVSDRDALEDEYNRDEQLLEEKDAEIKALQELQEKKDEIINQLIDQLALKSANIVSQVSSANMSANAGLAQVTALRAQVAEIIGDDALADEFLARIDQDAETLRIMEKHYPDYTPTTGYVSSPYGWREDPFTGISSWHSGMDICSGSGTYIYAAADGTVTYAGATTNGYGYLIEIDHGNGYTTKYAHLREDGVKVSVGDKVSKGEFIGLMGKTGRATGFHLHFEVLLYGNTQDPANYI